MTPPGPEECSTVMDVVYVGVLLATFLLLVLLVTGTERL